MNAGWAKVGTGTGWTMLVHHGTPGSRDDVLGTEGFILMANSLR